VVKASDQDKQRKGESPPFLQPRPELQGDDSRHEMAAEERMYELPAECRRHELNARYRVQELFTGGLANRKR